MEVRSWSVLLPPAGCVLIYQDGAVPGSGRRFSRWMDHVQAEEPFEGIEVTVSVQERIPVEQAEGGNPAVNG